VTLGRTHPPAADRWTVVRAAAEEIFGSSIADGVDHLWQPMDQLLGAALSGELPLAEVAAVLEGATDRCWLLGEVDVPSAFSLIRLYGSRTRRSSRCLC
jgi:hypothetical protein